MLIAMPYVRALTEGKMIVGNCHHRRADTSDEGTVALVALLLLYQ